MTELRRDVLLPFIILMAIVVITSAGSVALLGRMAPAIERILAENLYSLEAVEEMMIATCQPGDDADERFAAALARAQSNVTEDSERAPLEVLSDEGGAALAGDPGARRDALSALLELAEINRAAVVREDQRARRLGYAGAWAVVFLGALSFAWALIATARARRRLIAPVQEISSVLDAAHGGDTYRRCQHMTAPAEVRKIMTGVDELLDARALRSYAQQSSMRDNVDRQVLLYLLEQRQGPCWILTPDGSIDAANRAGLELLAGDEADEVRAALSAAAAGEPAPEYAIEALDGVERSLCERRAVRS